MQKINFRYWLCQVFGWGGWIFLNIFIAYQFLGEYYLTPESKKVIFFYAMAIDFISFILATHFLRMVLKQLNWMRFSIGGVVIMFVVGVVVTGFLEYYGSQYVAVLSNKSFEKYERNEKLDKALLLETELKVFNTTYYAPGNLFRDDSLNYKIINKIMKNTGWHRDAVGKWVYEETRKGRDFWNIVFCFILTALWLLIYLVWHYIEKNRNDQLDKLKLESTVKELELKTIKSHINPHFIFNSLNSIRALVDENPQRSRKAITELSNILRSSMQAEKSETVTLEKELDIIKDYLALEQMRFEERLKVEFQVDENTLQHPVPPMMLQTLVENAIKHGISKLVTGGVVRVICKYKGDNIELLVQNTGQLPPVINGDGFGIKSTEDRLNLMYQGKAKFEIRNAGNMMVESKVTMPVIL